MADKIDYGRLMHKAMRGLMCEVLSDVAQDGLPGDHHFFITFWTDHPGVDIGDSLRERYPQKMTIVLQDWFEDLAVTPERFSVTLNFGNVPERLVVPFEAIQTFVDPSMEFGLRFDAQEGEAEAGQPRAVEEADEEDGSADVVSLDTFRKH